MKKVITQQFQNGDPYYFGRDEYSLANIAKLYHEVHKSYQLQYKYLLDDGAEIKEILLDVDFSYDGNNESSWIIKRTESNTEYKERLRDEKKAKE